MALLRVHPTQLDERIVGLALGVGVERGLRVITKPIPIDPSREIASRT
jgi:hypothetical protein